jgi:hypothetical protein
MTKKAAKGPGRRLSAREIDRRAQEFFARRGRS